MVYYPERGVHSLNKFRNWSFLSKIHIYSDHNPLQYITEEAQRVLTSLAGHLLYKSLIACFIAGLGIQTFRQIFTPSAPSQIKRWNKFTHLKQGRWQPIRLLVICDSTFFYVLKVRYMDVFDFILSMMDDEEHDGGWALCCPWITSTRSLSTELARTTMSSTEHLHTSNLPTNCSSIIMPCSLFRSSPLQTRKGGGMTSGSTTVRRRPFAITISTCNQPA